MRLDGPGSDNFEDRTGLPGIGGGGGGNLFGCLIPLVASRFGLIGVAILLLGYCALTQMGGGGILGGGSGAPSTTREAPGGGQTKLTPEMQRFLPAVLGSTEQVWGDIFKRAGSTYQPTTLVAYKGGTQTGCGVGQAMMGPFYCPTDQRIYIDPDFFNELSRRFQAPGRFRRRLCHRARGRPPYPEPRRHARQEPGVAGAGFEIRRQCDPGRGRAPGRLLRRRVGRQRQGQPGPAGARSGRPRGRRARGRGDRRRYTPEADPGPGRPRKLHPRQLGPTHGSAASRTIDGESGAAITRGKVGLG